MKLAIDTSTRNAVIALHDGENIRSREFEPGATQKVIFTELASILDPDNLAALEAVIVGLGPGSFTGVKIGVTAAKTLAWSRGIKIIGINSLDAVAENVPIPVKDSVTVVVGVPSTRGEAYIRTYTPFKNEWVPHPDILDIKIETDSLDRILPENKLILAGECSEQIFEKIVSIRECPIPDKDFLRPSAEGLFRLGMKSLIAGTFDDPAALVPLYVRASQAERKLEEGTK
jgi:tRNA threonylcarbamoyl adenosine modification protein YeaZ